MGNSLVKINDIFEDDDTIVQGPWTKPVQQTQQFRGLKGPTDISKIKKVPMHKFVGGEYSILKELDINFIEKPGYWSEIFQAESMKVSMLPKIEEALGRKLENYYAKDLFESIYAPQAKVSFQKLKNNEETFTLSIFHSDIMMDIPYKLLHRNFFHFLCNRTGAQTYIRMWCYIDDQ